MKPNYNTFMSNQTKQERDPTLPVRPRRPFPLTLVFWTLILWTVLGWLRFSRAILDRELIMNTLGLGLFWYLTGAGLVWGLAGLPALWGLTFRSTWTPIVIAVDAVLFPAIYWVERLLLWQDQSGLGNWPFMLVLTLIWLGVVFWGLRGKQGQRFFSKQEKES
jgi:hypothetical protein